MAAAHGNTLVHFDLYPHNILLTAHRVVVVDWPHARLGAPFLDALMLVSSAAADGIDPDPILRHHAPIVQVDPRALDAVLAAHAGFLLATGLAPHPPGLQPIANAKIRLGHGSLNWLQQRLHQQ
jgi:aminoglycoside phosphotransferase (APT) family kinase protein